MPWKRQERATSIRCVRVRDGGYLGSDRDRSNGDKKEQLLSDEGNLYPMPKRSIGKTDWETDRGDKLRLK
jgi:hypothetical protein